MGSTGKGAEISVANQRPNWLRDRKSDTVSNLQELGNSAQRPEVHGLGTFVRTTPRNTCLRGLTRTNGGASRPAASTRMLGGLVDLIGVTVRAILGCSRLQAVSGPFPVLRFRFVGFWSREQARSASMNVGDIIQGEAEQMNRWRASWRHALPSTRTTATMTLHRSGLRNIRPLHARF